MGSGQTKQRKPPSCGFCGQPGKEWKGGGSERERERERETDSGCGWGYVPVC